MCVQHHTYTYTSEHTRARARAPSTNHEACLLAPHLPFPLRQSSSKP